MWRSSFGAKIQRISVKTIRKHRARETPQALGRRSLFFKSNSISLVKAPHSYGCQTSRQSFSKHTMTLWTISAGSASRRGFRLIPANTKHLSKVTQTPKNPFKGLPLKPHKDMNSDLEKDAFPQGYTDFGGGTKKKSQEAFESMARGFVSWLRQALYVSSKLLGLKRIHKRV